MRSSWQRERSSLSSLRAAASSSGHQVGWLPRRAWQLGHAVARAMLDVAKTDRAKLTPHAAARTEAKSRQQPLALRQLPEIGEQARGEDRGLLKPPPVERGRQRRGFEYAKRRRQAAEVGQQAGHRSHEFEFPGVQAAQRAPG